MHQLSGGSLSNVNICGFLDLLQMQIEYCLGFSDVNQMHKTFEDLPVDI